MAMMMAACATGSVFISKANVMPIANGKWVNVIMDSRESDGEEFCMRGRKPGTTKTTKVRSTKSPWFLVRAKIWW